MRRLLVNGHVIATASGKETAEVRTSDVRGEIFDDPGGDALRKLRNILNVAFTLADNITLIGIEESGKERAELRMPRVHPREGFVVAVYHGVLQNNFEFLVEVYEIYGRRNEPHYHYNPIDLTNRGSMKMEIKTIGSIDPPEEGSHLPPRFVRGQYPNCSWVRLR